MSDFAIPGGVFWGYFGNDVPIYLIGIVPMFVAIYRKHECHMDGCHRLGHYQLGHYHLCKKHHPAIPDRVTPDHIKKIYEARNG